jgi:deoxyribodipyrimidine photo-lyase
LVTEPWSVRTGTGGSYRVYTPFSKAVFAGHLPAAPLPAPTVLAPVPAILASDKLATWGLAPSKPDWCAGLAARWIPGEVGARQRLDTFLVGPADAYDHDRNFPDRHGVSYLSPHLRWGEISVRSVWHATATAAADAPARDKDTHTFMKELLWRDFAYHLLYHSPTMTTLPLNQKFSAFPWRDDLAGLRAWQQGRTGIPIVDAGMRELWATGYMHNRVRMIVGSFLVKHLLIPWQHGEAWFWDTLCDGDIASNTASWQWIAGCGADAAPFFRIFNPVTQGEKFDPNGTYLRIHVPELARLPTKVIHQPWSAPPLMLAGAGVRLGETYPAPIVDLKRGRERALAAYQTMKELAA